MSKKSMFKSAVVNHLRAAAALALAASFLFGLCACGGAADTQPPDTDSTAQGSAAPSASGNDTAIFSEPVSIDRDAPEPMLQAVNEAGAISLRQYIFTRLKTEAFITADFSAMTREEITAMVNELAALWDASSEMSASAGRTADLALSVLDASVAEQTSIGSAGGLLPIPLTAGAAGNGIRMLAETDPLKWAEALTAKYDAIKGGQKVKQLSEQLGTDARSAYEQLALAQEIIRDDALDDAAFQDKLLKIAMATKTACKVGVFVAGTIATGGGSVAALAGSSMTLGTAGAVIVGGTDCIVDIATTGSTIILGEDDQVTASFSDLKDKLAPVSAVVGLMTFNTGEAYEKLSYIGDSLTDWFVDGKILGVKVTGDDGGGTNVEARQADPAAAGGDAENTIKDMGFVPPEEQGAGTSLTDLLDDYTISVDEALGILDGLSEELILIAVDAGVYAYPALDELAGATFGGSITFEDIFVSDELKASAADPDGGDEECDLDILAMLEAMEGQTQSATFVLSKTSDTSGTFLMTTEDGGDAEPIPFTYSNGVLSVAYAADDSVVTGTIVAAYDGASAVTLDGVLTVTMAGAEDDFAMDIAVNASRTLA